MTQAVTLDPLEAVMEAMEETVTTALEAALVVTEASVTYHPTTHVMALAMGMVVDAKAFATSQ